MRLNELLKAGALHYGIDLEDHKTEQFISYMSLLKEWNKRVNLTAIEEDRDILVKHFIDSLSVAPHLTEDCGLIDIGTGAGFPGIPIKIALETAKVTLLDSLRKRVRFLEEAVRELGLKGIETHHGRAEDLGADSGFREKYDFAVARAVAGLPVLLEYCLPFVRVGGAFIAMKGGSGEEAGLSGKALELLGGEIEKTEEFVLPFSDIKRTIIIVRKLRHTPTKYPRKAGKPSKEPLI